MKPRFASTALLSAAAIALAGCASSGPGPFGERYQTPIPAGSTLVLERELSVPSGEARVFMQDGRVISEAVLGGASRFRPRCSFGLERKGNERLVSTIEPDRFRTGKPWTRAYAQNWPEEGVQVASTSLLIGQASSERGGAGLGYLTYVIEIPLSSSSQPQVDDFTCKVDRPGEWRGRLGLEAIQEAAGGIVRVELAEGSGTGSSSGY